MTAALSNAVCVLRSSVRPGYAVLRMCASLCMYAYTSRVEENEIDLRWLDDRFASISLSLSSRLPFFPFFFYFFSLACERTLVVHTHTHTSTRDFGRRCHRVVLFNFLREQRRRRRWPFPIRAAHGGSHPSMPRCYARQRRRRSYADFERATWTIREIFRPHDIFIKLTVHPPRFLSPSPTFSRWSSPLLIRYDREVASGLLSPGRSLK